MLFHDLLCTTPRYRGSLSDACCLRTRGVSHYTVSCVPGQAETYVGKGRTLRYKCGVQLVSQAFPWSVGVVIFT